MTWMRSKPDPELYRGFNNALRDDFSTEMRLFLSEVLLDNKNVLELLVGGLHLCQQPAGAALRHSRRAGRDVPAHTVDRCQPLRPAGQGRGAAAYFLSGSHFTGIARRWVLEKLLNTMTSPPPPGVETT